MSVKCIPPYVPLLYSKTRVCRGITIFLIFDPKHTLWVLVRSAHTIYVVSKNKKHIKIFLLKIFNFYNLRKIYILHGRVFVMEPLKQTFPVWHIQILIDLIPCQSLTFGSRLNT